MSKKRVFLLLTDAVIFSISKMNHKLHTVKIASIKIFLILVMVAWYLVDESVPKTRRGFICGDAALSLPFKKGVVRGIWLHINFYGVGIAVSVD